MAIAYGLDGSTITICKVVYMPSIRTINKIRLKSIYLNILYAVPEHEMASELP